MTDRIPAPQTRRWEPGDDIETRRTEILRSLGDVLRETKVSSLRMQDIADKLGLTKGNLYYYFKNKQDLLFHCHMRTMAGSLAALKRVGSMRGSASERLRELLVLHIHAVLDDSYGAVMLTDLEHLDEAQRAEYVALRDRFEHGVRTLIKEGIETGEFVDRNVTLAGFAILGGVNWMSKWYDPSGRDSSASIAQTFADIYVTGLKTDISERENAKTDNRAASRSR